MGEAKRRKELGLSPRAIKKTKSEIGPRNLFFKYPRLTYILIGLGVVYLIFDLVKYYNR